MLFCWEYITLPLLRATRPEIVVEVGSEHGGNTENLLTFCRQVGATLHAVDPAPTFDPDAWRGPSFVFHRALSLEALPEISDPDFVLLDGDHNCWTVYHELKVLEETSGSFPVVMLHDVGWPYGRRDLYYAPKTVPPEGRNPHRKGGMRPGETDLVEGGFNAGYENAKIEGGPKNGVLTAVEDFLKETSLELRFLKLPGMFGLGLLLREDAVAENLDLARLVADLEPSSALRAQLETVETARLNTLVAFGGARERLEDAKRRSEKHAGDLRAAKGEIKRLRSETKCLKSEMERLENSRAFRLLKRLPGLSP